MHDHDDHHDDDEKEKHHDHVKEKKAGHTDKEHQLALLDAATDIDWFGIRPLQMSAGPMRAQYRLGFDRFSGMSRITFADCAHAMLGMLEGDTWRHKAPIVQY